MSCGSPRMRSAGQSGRKNQDTPIRSTPTNCPACPASTEPLAHILRPHQHNQDHGPAAPELHTTGDHLRQPQLRALSGVQCHDDAALAHISKPISDQNTSPPKTTAGAPVTMAVTLLRPERKVNDWIAARVARTRGCNQQSAEQTGPAVNLRCAWTWRFLGAVTVGTPLF